MSGGRCQKRPVELGLLSRLARVSGGPYSTAGECLRRRSFTASPPADPLEIFFRVPLELVVLALVAAAGVLTT